MLQIEKGQDIKQELLQRYKGIIKDRSSIKESNDVISLRKKFKSEDIAERKKILEKFENGELTL